MERFTEGKNDLEEYYINLVNAWDETEEKNKPESQSLKEALRIICFVRICFKIRKTPLRVVQTCYHLRNILQLLEDDGVKFDQWDIELLKDMTKDMLKEYTSNDYDAIELAANVMINGDPAGESDGGDDVWAPMDLLSNGPTGN